ncbi:MAG: lamin tail domain-containing protein [Candidatus Marinimicrobia bacterium]|nr:lamin tail domain-containing protein [Candidatus Neomarinimicrobiota bacterium]
MYRISLVMLAISLQASDLRISEVMSNPQGSEYENEFIEIYNCSAHVMHVNGWVMSDGSGVDSLVHLSGPDSIPAQGYALIMDPGYQFSIGPYIDLIPDSIPIYTISTDATFGSGGLANSAESVIVWNADSSSLSQMSWSKATDNGYSWERVSLEVADDAAEWKQSLVENGTPGTKNSRALPAYNLWLSSVDISQMDSDLEVQLSLTMINTGAAEITSAALQILLVEADHLFTLHEEVLTDIPPGDSLIWEGTVGVQRCGWMQFEIEVECPHDDFVEDNKITEETFITCLTSPLIINEVMPVPLSEEPEWVEIFNRSGDDIDLLEWQFSDNNLTSRALSDTSLILRSGSYLLLSSQGEISGCPWDCLIQPIPGFPTLNNSGDAVILYDPNGSIMDQMSYDEGSGIVEGHSWERINTENPGTDIQNWGFCVSATRSTPGYKNSLHLTELSTELSIDLNPNPFTPDGDGNKDQLIIHYELPFQQALVSMIIYDMAGRRIAEPVQVKAVPHRGQLSWDGTANYGGIAATGLYICILFVDDMQGHVFEELRKVYLLR